jgi:hypothetical protein
VITLEMFLHWPVGRINSLAALAGRDSDQSLPGRATRYLTTDCQHAAPTAYHCLRVVPHDGFTSWVAIDEHPTVAIIERITRLAVENH